MKLYVLTYQSGQYSDWNIQNLGVYTSVVEAEKARDAYRAQTGVGWTVGTGAVCHGAPQYPEGGSNGGEFGIEEHEANAVAPNGHVPCKKHGL